jgi:hypothetical protein
MECSQIILKKHLLRRVIERAFRPLDILAVVQRGEIVERREENGETVYVLLGSPSGRPIHVVLSRDTRTGDCEVITAYYPDLHQWTAGFRRRRR